MPLDSPNPPPPPRPCPICGKPSPPGSRPFCSRRCAQIDLGRWLDGRYRIAGDEAAETDEEAGRDPG